MKKVIRPTPKTYANILVYKETSLLLDQLVKVLDLNKIVIAKDCVEKYYKQFVK